MEHHKTLQLNREDIRNDIAAALNLCTAIEYGVLRNHKECPYLQTAIQAKSGLVKLLGRFEK